MQGRTGGKGEDNVRCVSDQREQSYMKCMTNGPGRCDMAGAIDIGRRNVAAVRKS